MGKNKYNIILAIIALGFIAFGVGFKLWTEDVVFSDNIDSLQAIKAYKIEKSRNGLSVNSIKQIAYNNNKLSASIKNQLSIGESPCAKQLMQKINTLEPDSLVFVVIFEILEEVNNYEQITVSESRTTKAWNVDKYSCEHPIIFKHVKNEEGVFLLKEISQLNLYYDCACEYVQ